MSLCQCSERPRCQWDWCTNPADWSVWQPRWCDRPERFRFMCDWHFKAYKGPIRGIDPPERATESENWKPTLGFGLRAGFMQELERTARWATAMRDMRKADRAAGRET